MNTADAAGDAFFDLRKLADVRSCFSLATMRFSGATCTHTRCAAVLHVQHQQVCARVAGYVRPCAALGQAASSYACVQNKSR